jgi:hypothetical protein
MTWVVRNKAAAAVAAITAVLAVVGGIVFVGQSAATSLILWAAVVAVTAVIFRLWTRGTVAAGSHWPWGKVAVSAVAAALIVGLGIQLIPYGRDHTEPPVSAEPAWDSPRTRELAVAACFDCHSNEVSWPWYTNIAPMSWAAQRHVDGGRDKVNFSEWDRPQDEAEESAETVREGEMPPSYYNIVFHAGSRLDDQEKEELARGLEATFRADPPLGGGDD